jgi:hypothetical protein
VGYKIAAVSGETRMKMTIKTLAILSLTAALLAGCTSMNVFKDDSSPPPPVEKDLAPEEPEAPLKMSSAPNSASKSGLKAAEINKALSGKSWKWVATTDSGATISGVTLYANDGSSLVEISGKGTTTGKWAAKDGELCESMAPAPFLPKGKDSFCNPMSRSGNGYKVGAATFTLAN